MTVQMDIAAVMNTSLTCMYSSPSVVNSSVFSGENLRQTQIEITVNISAQNQKGKLYVKDVFKTIKIFLHSDIILLTIKHIWLQLSLL